MGNTPSTESTEIHEPQPSVRLRDAVARNVAWNWIGTLVDMVAGFVVAPFLVHRLGNSGYGLWVVIGSLSGYFSLVDFGMRGSLGRQLAFQRAKNDHLAVNRVLSSGVAILSVVGVITIIATLIATALFDRLFETPPELLPNARLALILVGVNLALSFPLQVFDGNLWASQRFDILNFIDIPATVLRVGLTFAFVRGANDIITLALITLTVTILSGTAKAIWSFRLDRMIEVRRSYVRWSEFQELFEYGFWNFTLTIARMTKTQLSPIMIGALLGVALVTPFSIARRLQDYAHRVLWTATGVLMPVATRFHARSETAQQRNLFIQGAKYSTAVAIFFLAYFVCVGKALITLWMGPTFAFAGTLLIILTLGEFLQMTQSATGSIILATAQHRFLAIVSLVETIVTIAIMVYASRSFGLVGAAAAIAIPQAAFTGLTMLIHGCRTTGVGPLVYLREAVVTPVLAAAPAIVVLASLSIWLQPHTWAVLIAYSILYGCIYGVTALLILRPFKLMSAT